MPSCNAPDRRRVPAAANGDFQGIGFRHPYAVMVGRIRALGNQARLAANHSVVDFPRFFIRGIVGFDDRAAEMLREIQ